MFPLILTLKVHIFLDLLTIACFPGGASFLNDPDCCSSPFIGLVMLEGCELSAKGCNKRLACVTTHDDLEFLQHLIMLPCKSNDLIVLRNLGYLVYHPAMRPMTPTTSAYTCHGDASTSRWPVAHFAGLAEISLRVR